ncbi:MAG: diadenylate cyclase CdaA [Oscillospiraceae bacterium]|nr:diadenylate cyclase CdaA [Oscillospiraceae bacterium]
MSEFFEEVGHYIKTVSFTDVLDIALVAFLVYYILRFIHGTYVKNIVKGIVMLLALYYISDLIKLNTINYILKNTLQIGFIALVIVFQPELRKGLENLGTTRFSKLLRRTEEESERKIMIREVVEAASSMSWSHTGALIIFERDTLLTDIVTAATEVDARPSSELIKNIFFVKAPLHDGAMIIRGDRILAAGCVLPLSENESLPKELGTRHRAGIGITEQTDAISLIVSEETGAISVAMGGEIKRNMAASTVENLLTTELITKREEQDMKDKPRKWFAAWRAKEK